MSLNTTSTSTTIRHRSSSANGNLQIIEGPLSKWTNVMQGWQCRWFVLDQSSGLLSYYTSRQKMRLGVRRGCIRLINGKACIGLDDEDKNVFTITDLAVDKTFHFMTKDHEERTFWMKHLEETIKYTKTNNAMNTHGSMSSPMGQSAIGPVAQNAHTLHHSSNPQNNNSSIIQNSSNIHMNLHNSNNIIDPYNLPNSSCAAELPTKTQNLATFNQNQREISSLNKIIKNSCLSASSSRNSKIGAVLSAAELSLNSLDDAMQNLGTGSSEIPAHYYDGSTTTSISSMSNNRIDFNDGKGDFKQNVKKSTQGPMSSQAPCIRDSSQPDNHAPPYSFSSGDEDSDDEVVENGSGSKAKSYADDDEFFDADEGSYSERATIVSQETSDSKTSNKKLLSKHMRSMSIQSSITSDDFFMPEEDNSIDEEEVDMGKQPVIRYLISQVRIGMDLTRIPLPTFILESRSLLEMYSAFFAHPDIFCCIADKTSPRERFMQVVKWYLSSLHAGRKSNVAKKPYNPILGEQFHCLFDPRDGGSSSEYKTSSMDPNNNKHGENGKPVFDDQSIPLPNPAETQKSEQPLPWATKHHVQFSAEQVSHHPPISAFYAENIEKNIQFNAQIWTKSKFLGLSICVHNIGQGVISLSGGAGKGEEYVVTFPSGYGRSILSIPWIELGGQCEIRCAKTGYTATVDFHTKPFYGGKLHRTTTKVYSPSDKRTASVVLEGEWNGSIKYTSGGPPKGVFIDTQNIPIYRKYVRRMEKQQNHESRKMWSRVTNALATNNIDEASDGKNALEEKQRADRGHREENGITWENKLFTKVDDLWIFKNSLSKRLDDAEKSDK